MSSYISLADAQTFFDTEIETAAWDRATNAQRTKALETSTRLIDQLNFKDIYVFTDKTDTDIPEDFKIANALLALTLLEGVNTEDEINRMRTSAENVQGISKSYKDSVFDYTIDGIVNHRAYKHLYPYLKDGRSISLERV